jgi:lipopolysaccharide/colanic/teichoic acid biosynthesis glycosyltransferase
MLELVEPAGNVAVDRRAHRWSKRALDLFGATLALVFSVPLWLLIALAIKLDSPGPVLLRQLRVGRNGKTFVFYKFRSMCANNDDARHRQYVADFMKGTRSNQLAGARAYFKMRQDPRVTRIGRFLRRTSLDEVPQLLNVLRGEMSLVGPRPPLPYEVDNYELWQLARLRVLPGITGIWQVYGRSRVSFEQMVRMDLDYIARSSVWLDLKLLLLTVPAVLKGAGAE